MDGDKPYVTDNDNYIVDLYFTEPIKDAKKAGEEIAQVRQETTLVPRVGVERVGAVVVASSHPLHLSSV